MVKNLKYLNTLSVIYDLNLNTLIIQKINSNQ